MMSPLDASFLHIEDSGGTGASCSTKPLIP